MARKINISEQDSESSLSSAPEDLILSAVEVETLAVRTKRKAVAKEESASEDEAIPKTKTKTKKQPAKKIKVEGENGEITAKKAPTKRRSKKGVVQAPLEERTVGSKLRVGAHVSTAGGVHNAISNLLHIGANAFALFLKNQRKWENPPLDPVFATAFLEGCKTHNIDAATCCLPHGSYLVNLAHPEPARKKQAYDSFLDDLTRCNTLGIKLFNFHPGNSNASTREEGIKTIAENINRAHNDPNSGDVIPILETMASLGNTIGGTFKDIADIIALVVDKNRIGVCMDTCHVFAAGYDIRTPAAYAATMAEFDKVIGLQYLKALHINDSKAPLKSNRDLHARIGTGYIGLLGFWNIVNDDRLHGLPMTLETPIDTVVDGKKIEDKSIWAREIKMLEKLVGMDFESEEFKTLEKDLQEEGTGEREKIGDQVERKKAKDAKAGAPKVKKETTEKAPKVKKDAAEKAPRKSRSKKAVKEEIEEEDEEENE